MYLKTSGKRVYATSSEPFCKCSLICVYSKRVTRMKTSGRVYATSNPLQWGCNTHRQTIQVKLFWMTLVAVKHTSVSPWPIIWRWQNLCKKVELAKTLSSLDTMFQPLFFRTPTCAALFAALKHIARLSWQPKFVRPAHHTCSALFTLQPLNTLLSFGNNPNLSGLPITRVQLFLQPLNSLLSFGNNLICPACPSHVFSPFCSSWTHCSALVITRMFSHAELKQIRSLAEGCPDCYVCCYPSMELLSACLKVWECVCWDQLVPKWLFFLNLCGEWFSLPA